MMNRWLKKTSDGAAVAVGCIIVLMMLHVTAEVLLRVLFELHIPGTMEVVTYYYMVTAVFIGIFSCTVEDCHVRVDVFAQFLRGGVRRLVDWVGAIAVAAYFGIFAYGLYLKAVGSWKRQETVDAIAFQLTTWPSRWLALAGIFLAFLASLYGVYRLLVSKDVQQEDKP
ncbi:TRAP transporter small permease [Marinobacter salinexigens]|uniref:TRAP transporter small permease protein n=2 Tax=Marinobacter salinexigens TaxID=2919747 RepID=A0A5B0VDC7_9GAMM|nr:TRAP transporter small permease [Marinobacter salinexigens]